MLAPLVSLPEGELNSLLASALRRPATPIRTQSEARARPGRSGSLLGRALAQVVEQSSDQPASDEIESFPSTARRQLGAIQIQPEANAVSSELVATGRDRRVFSRHESDCEVTLTMRGPTRSQDAQQACGRVVDVSMGGLALRMNRPCEAGAEVGVQLSNPHFVGALDVEGTVLRCQPDSSAGYWHVVCTLSRRLTFEQVNFVGKQLFASTLV